ncbi:MAG TPA: iron chelate uptake ABC transporter family permease subunit, partial [Nitrospirota bacterium]
MSKIRMSILIAFALLIVLCSVLLGPRIISPFGLSATDREILFSIRLPRVLVALLMGMALGASGAVLQGILRNPL